MHVLYIPSDSGTDNGIAFAGRGGRGGAAGRRPSGSGKAIPLVPQQRGGGANSNSGLGSERTAWLLLIGMLEKKCVRRAHLLHAVLLQPNLAPALQSWLLCKR